MNKKKILLLSLASLLLVSCGTKHLTKEEALLRAETMKEKVENGEVTPPSALVYTQEMVSTYIDSEYHIRYQVLADYKSNYYVIEEAMANIFSSEGEDVKKSVSNGYYLFIQDNQLIYAKTTVLRKEYMVLYEASSSGEEKLIEELNKYCEIFVPNQNALCEMSIAAYDLESFYNMEGFKEKIPEEHKSGLTYELVDEASYVEDSDLYIKANFVASKEGTKFEMNKEYNFSNYLVSSYKERYVETINGEIETFDFSYMFQQNISYNRLNLSTFEKVNYIEFYKQY